MPNEAKNCPVCRCGFDRGHPMVTPERSYGLGAWITLFAGASATPKKVAFRCQRCNQVVEETRDPKVLEKHRS